MLKRFIHTMLLVCALAGLLVAPAFAQESDDNPETTALETVVTDQSVTQTKWSALGIGNALNGDVHAIAINGTDVYVGGEFTNAGGIPEADYIAKWDGAKWSAVGNNGGAFNGAVKAIVIKNNEVYVGGYFTDVAGLWQADYIARWNGNAWYALGGSGGTGALNSSVESLAFFGNDLYVGGYFTDAAGIAAADRIAKWDGSAWSALGSHAGDGVLNSAPLAFAVMGNDLYVAGGFQVQGKKYPFTNNDVKFLARWDGADWHAVGTSQISSGYATSLAVMGNDLYVGGIFWNAFGIATADHLIKWDGSAWSAVGNNGAGDGALNNMVTTLAVIGNELYAGGSFTNAGIGITGANYLAKWNGSTWSAVGGSGTLDNAVYTLAVRIGGLSNGSLYAGGGFTNVSTGDAYTGNANFVALHSVNTTFFSEGAQDGWILESAETSNKGGKVNKGSVTLNVGDDAANKQYRAILSFDTSSIPSTSVITSVRLLFKYVGKQGALPFGTHGKLLVDVRKGPFNNNPALQLGDFNATSGKNGILSFNSTRWNDWYVKQLSPAHFQYINKGGVTQFRLRFAKDDNNDLGADFVKIYSGNSSQLYAPQLMIEYTPGLAIVIILP